MKPASNKFFGFNCSFFRIFNWSAWMFFWLIAILIPCLLEAATPKDGEKWYQIGNESIGIVILYDNSRMWNSINPEKYRSQDGFKGLGPPVKLDSFYSVHGGKNTKNATYDTANKGGTQGYDNVIHNPILFLIAIAVGCCLGFCAVATFTHLFIVPSDWWVLNKIFS